MADDVWHSLSFGDQASFEYSECQLLGCNQTLELTSLAEGTGAEVWSKTQWREKKYPNKQQAKSYCNKDSSYKREANHTVSSCISSCDSMYRCWIVGYEEETSECVSTHILETHTHSQCHTHTLSKRCARKSTRSTQHRAPKLNLHPTSTKTKYTKLPLSTGRHSD